MNATSPSKSSLAVYTVAILGSFLIIAGMVWVLKSHNQPAPPNTKRIQERKDASLAVRQGGIAELTSYGYTDATKGLVRIPVEQVMSMVVNQWKTPANVRSNLLARLKVATAVPPKQPEKPSPFE